LVCLARGSNYALHVTNLCDVRTCGRNCTKVANGDSVDFVSLCMRGFYRVLRNNSDESRSNDGKDGLRVAIRKHGLQSPKFDHSLGCAALLAIGEQSLVLPGYWRTLILGVPFELEPASLSAVSSFSRRLIPSCLKRNLSG
jgi:hypothetical protein